MPWFFLSFTSELVVLFLELGGRIGSLERELETAKVVIGQSTEALAKSLEERRALEGELNQIHNVVQVVVSEVFGSVPSTNMPAIQLVLVPNEVRVLISDGMFYGTLGVLTSVAMHHPDLDFAAIYRGYINGWSADAIHALGESLVPYVQMVAEQVSAQWMMEARHSSMAEGVHQEDVIQPTDGVETGSEASIVPPPTELNVIPSEGEQPLSSSTVPSADAAGRS